MRIEKAEVQSEGQLDASGGTRECRNLSNGLTYSSVNSSVVNVPCRIISNIIYISIRYTHIYSSLNNVKANVTPL